MTKRKWLDIDLSKTGFIVPLKNPNCRESCKGCAYVVRTIGGRLNRQ